MGGGAMWNKETKVSIMADELSALLDSIKVGYRKETTYKHGVQRFIITTEDGVIITVSEGNRQGSQQ